MNTNSIRSTEGRFFERISYDQERAQELPLDSFHSVLNITIWWWRGHICGGARDPPDILRKAQRAQSAGGANFNKQLVRAWLCAPPSHGEKVGENEMKDLPR